MESQPQSTPHCKATVKWKCGPLTMIIVGLVIGGLFAFIVPNWRGAQLKAKAAAVKGNMRTLQIAAESYSTDSGGACASSIRELAPFLPGGANGLGGSPPPNFKFNLIKKVEDLALVKDGDFVDISEMPEGEFLRLTHKGIDDSSSAKQSPSTEMRTAVMDWLLNDEHSTKIFAAYRPTAGQDFQSRRVYSSYEVMGLYYRDKKIFGALGGVLSNQ